ncbi:MAG: ATP-binding cassette domain-containing protein [Acidimicrobiales bacterium]|nr:ATP-binding cassette domain-containing protein [Acidimicrobiales bacterium]
MIRTRDLTRTFGAKDKVVQAVKGITLDVEPGEVVAFLGPNGAGKSTTLRMLTTLLNPTSGSAEVAGFDVVKDPAAVRHRIGAIGQGNGAGQNQKVIDEMVGQGRAYGLTKSESKARADELLAGLDLSDLADRVVQTLSGGQRRRLDVALGMVHQPELLFLDEPSTGLDPQNRANLKDLIEKLHAEHGTTVVLTTHYMDEADSLADRVIVIDHGRIIADDSPARLRSGLVGDRLDVTLPDPTDVPRVVAAIERMATPLSVNVAGPTVQARIDGAPQLVPQLMRVLDADRVVVAAAEVARATLDDVFLHLTGRSLREGSGPVDIGRPDGPAGPSSEPSPSPQPSPSTESSQPSARNEYAA